MSGEKRETVESSRPRLRPPSAVLRPRLSRPHAVLLAALAVLPFLNGLTGDFTYDDKPIIRDNPRLSSPAAFPEIFTTHYFGGSLATATAYRPLVLATYAVQRWIFGNDALVFHVVNVGLHAAMTLLFGGCLVRLGFTEGAATAAAALFAVLTIHVEAVTGLVGRAEVLAALLVFLSALLWLAATPGAAVRPRPLAGAILAFFLAVFVKENAVVVPGVVALGELVRKGPLRERVRKLRGAFALLFLPIAALFAVRRVVLKGFLISKQAGIFDLENPLVVEKPILRAANASILVFRYIAKTFVPIGLSADHSAYALPLVSRATDPRALLAVLGLIAVSLAAFFARKRVPLSAYGWAFFLGTLFPVSNLPFAIGTIYAERLAYLPSAGLACVVVGLFTPRRVEVPRPSRLAWKEALLVAALVAYGTATVLRNRVFASDTSLYADMVRKVPRSAKAHYNLAFDTQRRGDPAAARPHLVTANAIFPRYYDAWALLAKLDWDAKRLSEAVDEYRKSVQILPTYENGLWGLAKTLEASGRMEEAAQAFEDGVKKVPGSYPIAYHHAAFLQARGRLLPAEREWERAVRTGSGAAMARLGLAKCLSSLGREEESWREARRALLVDPRLANARMFLAQRYEAGGKTLGAAAELCRAARSAPADAEVAAALLELGIRRPETWTRVTTCLPIIRRSFGADPEDERLRSALARYP